MSNYFVKQLIFFILFSLFNTSIVIGQTITIKLGVKDSIQSTILKENRKFIIHFPQGYDTAKITYTVLYPVDGSEEWVVFFSSMRRFILKRVYYCRHQKYR
jgi:phage pi2 protein 07